MLHRLDELLADNIYLGAERTYCKVGRSAESKGPFVAAVSLKEAGNAQNVRPMQVQGFTMNAIFDCAKHLLRHSSTVFPDGQACFAVFIRVVLIDSNGWPHA